MQAALQVGFGEGELVVLSLEAAPGRRPQPAVSRGLVVACDAGGLTLLLQRRLRASIANPPAQVLFATTWLGFISCCSAGEVCHDLGDLTDDRCSHPLCFVGPRRP